MSACDRSASPTPSPSTSALDRPPPIPVIGPERPILVFGDSLLASHGIEGGELYPLKLEAAMRARGINARIFDAGVSGETTGQALRRLTATLDARSTEPEVVIISLGGTDMLLGLPPAQTRTNLSRILSFLRERRIRVVLLGMLAAPNLSREYARDFNPIYPTVAERYDAVLVPFYLQPLREKPEVLQADPVHPSAHGIDEIVAATLDDIVDALPDP